MGQQINQYTKDRIQSTIEDDDLLDVDSTDDAGSSYESAKMKVLEFVNYIKSQVQTFYTSDGTLTGNRNVTANGNFTKFNGGDVIVKVADEITDNAFLVNDISDVEKARMGFDQATDSGEILLENNTGTYFEASNGDLRVRGFSDSELFAVDGSSDRIGVGTVVPDAKLDIKGENDLATEYMIKASNNSGNCSLAIDNVGKSYLGLVDTASNITDFGSSAINIKIGESNGRVNITNATIDGTTPNTTAQNSNLTFSTRNSAGNIANVQNIFVRNRNVTSGSEYGVMVIGSAIHTENSTGTAGRTVVSSRDRHTFGGANAIFQVENRENDTNTTFLVDQFSQNTGLSFAVRSGSAGTSADTYSLILRNNHEFEHNFGKLSTGDFILNGTADNVMVMDASANKVGFGTATPSENVHSAAKVRADTGFNYNGNDGVTQVLTFGGGSTGDVATMTVEGGIITGVTLVP